MDKTNIQKDKYTKQLKRKTNGQNKYIERQLDRASKKKMHIWTKQVNRTTNEQNN